MKKSKMHFLLFIFVWGLFCLNLSAQEQTKEKSPTRHR